MMFRRLQLLSLLLCSLWAYSHSRLEEMIKKLLKWFWRGNADENIEQKEYESMSGLIEEFGDEQEQEDIDIVFDNLQDNQEKSL